MNTLLALARRHCRLPWLLLILLSAACTSETSAPASAAAAADTPPPAADTSTPARADERVLVDLRQPVQDATPADVTTTQRVVAAVYGDGAPQDVTIAGQAQGAFTAPGRAQTVYLLVRGSSGTAPDAPRPMLAVFEGDTLLTQFVPDVHYDTLVAAADPDRDGTEALLLRADGYQMGQSFASLHLLSLAGGKRELLQRFDEAYLDSCENPVGERSVHATVLLETPNGLRADVYRAPCPPQGEAQPADFRPVSR